MTTATTVLQWGLLIGFAALVVYALLAGWKFRHLRSLAFLIGFLGFTHAAYYTAFLVFPDWLSANPTMTFSVVIRYQVLFTLALGLGLAVKKWRW